MVYVVVGFRINKERAVFYRKCKDEEELKNVVVEAFKKAHFVSIRKVQRA